ncbi:hypothetical protein L9F63_007932 [Diploptera punctata]|uniref:Sodium-dependent glucose transporter 1 n=1 Tax=Diploptera punctata TaxID=6984 RepID=A0AAD7Z7I3_DIPPU|nr:hypothetical protein L9F63_007932 [Diploptera punctata]
MVDSSPWLLSWHPTGKKEDPFEEDIVFDQAGLLSNTTKMSTAIRRVSSGKCALFAKTLGLCGAFFGLGLCIAIPGPTFLSPVTELQADISPISSIYAARTSGYLIGSIIGGFLFDYFNRLFLLFISLLLTAVFITVTPWCHVLWLLQACMVFLGMTMGFLDTGGNVLCLDLWGRNSGPFMQALHFSFGLGAFVAPLLAAPFLETNSIDVLPTTIASTTLSFPSPEMRGRREVYDNATEILYDHNQIWLDSTTKLLENVSNLFSSSTEHPTSSFTSKIMEIKTYSSVKPTSTTVRTRKPKPQKIDTSFYHVKKPSTEDGITTVSSIISILQTTPSSEANISNPTFTNDITSKSEDFSTVTKVFTSSYPHSLLNGISSTSELSADNSTTSTKETYPAEEEIDVNKSPVQNEYKNVEMKINLSGRNNMVEVPEVMPTPQSIKPPNSSNPSIKPPNSSIEPPNTSIEPPNTSIKPPISSIKSPNTSIKPPNSSITPPNSSITPPNTLIIPPNTSIKPPNTSIKLPDSSIKQTSVVKDNVDPSAINKTLGEEELTVSSWTENEDISTTENLLPKHIHHKPLTYDNDTEVINSVFDIVANRIEKYGFTKIQFTYLMVGLFVFAISLVFLGFLCHNPRDPKSKQEEGQVAKKISSKTLHGMLISLMAIFFLLYVGLEVTYGQLVLAFAVIFFLQRELRSLLQLYWPCDRSRRIWGSFAAMAFASIFFSSELWGPITMLVLNFVFCTLGTVLLSSMASHTETALWVGTALLGIGLASVFPTGILWIERYIHVSNKVAAAFVMGASLGEMVCPVAVYHLMVNDPAMLMHSAVVINILCILTFIALRWLALRHGEKYCVANNNGYQLANQDEEEDMFDMSPSGSVMALRRHSFSSEHRALLNGNPHRGP